MRLFALRALYFLLGSVIAGRSAEQAPTLNDPHAVATEVRAIFEAKCADCHGAQLPRPKGKFGYVLDLQRIAANQDYVVPGKPDESELYAMLLHDEMPGEDAMVDSLTPQEKETVKHWIELGAPSEMPPAVDKIAAAAPAESGAMASAEQAPRRAERPRDSLWRQAVKWVGRFHPMSTHFPVALMLVAVVAEALAWWTQRESWMQTVRFLVVLAALGGFAASGLGWMNAYFSSYSKAPGALLWWHRWIGTGTAAWSGLCAVLVCASPCAEGSRERRRFRGALLVGAALVAISGFLGSALIYGLEHYAWN
jgi:uncharacterized membrane protein